MLIAPPLLIFIMVTFILPVADMLFRSVENSIVSDNLPRTVLALDSWDANSGELPSEEVFAALAADLKEAAEAKTHTKVGSRLNYEMPGIASLFRKTGRKAKKFDLEAGGPPWREELIDVNEDWGGDPPEVWRTIQTYSPSYTSGYYLNAVDMQVGVDGPELRPPEDERIYMLLLKRTMWMSLLITFSCIVLGYPVAGSWQTCPCARRTC